MPRMNPTAARSIADSFGIPLGRDFHGLSSEIVGRVIAAADSWHYREPASANGSRARYFYAYLQRTAARDED